MKMKLLCVTVAAAFLSTASLGYTATFDATLTNGGTLSGTLDFDANGVPISGGLMANVNTAPDSVFSTDRVFAAMSPETYSNHDAHLQIAFNFSGSGGNNSGALDWPLVECIDLGLCFGNL